MPKARHIARLRAAEKIPAGQFEDWLALAVRQLLGPQQLLFTRTGVMFGVSDRVARLHLGRLLRGELPRGVRTGGRGGALLRERPLSRRAGHA